jgi:hypothetical protein
MEMLPPTGWGEVATRQQLDAVEDRFELRLDTLEQRFEARLDHGLDRVRLELAVGQRRMLQWLAATMVVMTGVFAALTRLG